MKEIEVLFEQYKNAVYQKDVTAFTAIFDEKVLIFDMWVQWTYDGLASWREMAEGWFASLGNEHVVVTFSDVQITASGEMAAATAFVKFEAISEKGEQLRYLENRLTWVAKQESGTWKVIHQHTSSPISFENMQVILKR